MTRPRITLFVDIIVAIYTRCSVRSSFLVLWVEFLQLELRVAFGGQAGQGRVFVLVDELHGFGQHGVGLGQFFVHLVDQFSVAGVALRAGAQLVQVEGFAGVVGDFPAHFVAQQRGVLRLQLVAHFYQQAVQF